MMVSEEILQALGIDVRRVSDREIQALCPVHHLVKGRPDTRPSWYINRYTGAWLCFSCQQRGGLRMLVELMDGDMDLLEDVPIEVMKARVASWHEDDEPEEKKESVYISEYGFSKNPLPPKGARLNRDIRKDACELHNVRWDKEGRCFLIPLYTIAEGKLIGWQEKSKGYFNNVPKEVEKRKCLFGYQQFTRGPAIIVESPLDVVRMTSYGLHGGMATMGSYVSEEQIEGILKVTDDVILAFDNDEAGDQARDHVGRAIKKRQQATVRYFRYPSKRLGKDPGELEFDYVRSGVAGATVVPTWRKSA